MVIIDEIVEPTTVQLGFSEPIEAKDKLLLGHASASWGEWDGGIIGGKPSWLNPKELPSAPLACRECSTGLRFICQLYAPSDEVNPNAYHRALYVFGCPVCCSDTKRPPEGSIRVLRCQLPLENEFYPPTDTDDTDWNQHQSIAHGIELCRVCGQRGKGKCPIQKVSFCGREHQKEHKKFVFEKKRNSTETTPPSTFLPSVYTKSELVVDEEPPPEDGKEEEREALMPSEEENDPDEDLEQDDLDDMAGKKYKTTQDPVTTDFSARVKRAQDQCLRYYPKWQNPDGPLWIRSEPVPTDVSPCRYCGGDRKCEFQIMPQMLYHLLEGHRKFQALQSNNAPIVSAEGKHALSVAAEIVEFAPPEHVPPALKERHDETVANIQKKLLESDANELDWGVIAVYTCTKSCSEGGVDDELGAYREEYTWKQPPP